MTLLVVLLLGLGGVLVVSAIETDPGTGKSVSIMGTLGDIWNNTLDFSQPAMSQGFAGVPAHREPEPIGTVNRPPASPGVGGALPAAASATDQSLAHRQSLVREWTRHTYGV